MKKIEKNIEKKQKIYYNAIKVVLGDICYPKSEALIIEANTKGTMSTDVPYRIAKAGLGSIFKESKEYTNKNIVKIEQVFSTGPGRLNRRGVKKIYHAVIKNLQSDFTSIYIVRNALENTFKEILKDKMKSVTLGGIGLDCLSKRTVATIIIETCNKYRNKIEIKIIDNDEEFITEINNLIKE